jgi:hypothetical protein
MVGIIHLENPHGATLPSLQTKGASQACPTDQTAVLVAIRARSLCPGKGSADGEFNGRSQIRVLPCVSVRTSSKVLPSGEILGQGSGRVSGGATTEEMSKGGRKVATLK